MEELFDYKTVRDEQKLKNLIQSGFTEVTEDDCDGYYRKMSGYINRCLNNEIIFEWTYVLKNMDFVCTIFVYTNFYFWTQQFYFWSQQFYFWLQRFIFDCNNFSFDCNSLILGRETL